MPRYEYPQVTNPAQHQVTVNQKGRTEHICVNLEAIYHSPHIVGSELSLDELRAASRGWLSKVWEPEYPAQEDPSPVEAEIENEVEAIVRDIPEKLVIARDAIPLDENGAPIMPGREGRGRRMKIKEVNETQISELQVRFFTESC